MTRIVCSYSQMSSYRHEEIGVPGIMLQLQVNRCLARWVLIYLPTFLPRCLIRCCSTDKLPRKRFDRTTNEYTKKNPGQSMFLHLRITIQSTFSCWRIFYDLSTNQRYLWLPGNVCTFWWLFVRPRLWKIVSKSGHKFHWWQLGWLFWWNKGCIVKWNWIWSSRLGIF